MLSYDNFANAIQISTNDETLEPYAEATSITITLNDEA